MTTTAASRPCAPLATACATASARADSDSEGSATVVKAVMELFKEYGDRFVALTRAKVSLPPGLESVTHREEAARTLGRAAASFVQTAERALPGKSDLRSASVEQFAAMEFVARLAPGLQFSPRGVGVGAHSRECTARGVHGVIALRDPVCPRRTWSGRIIPTPCGALLPLHGSSSQKARTYHKRAHTRFNPNEVHNNSLGLRLR